MPHMLPGNCCYLSQLPTDHALDRMMRHGSRQPASYTSRRGQVQCSATICRVACILRISSGLSLDGSSLLRRWSRELRRILATRQSVAYRAHHAELSAVAHCIGLRSSTACAAQRSWFSATGAPRAARARRVQSICRRLAQLVRVDQRGCLRRRSKQIQLRPRAERSLLAVASSSERARLTTALDTPASCATASP